MWYKSIAIPKTSLPLPRAILRHGSSYLPRTQLSSDPEFDSVPVRNYCATKDDSEDQKGAYAQDKRAEQP